jgi:hypothetical protein
MNRVCVRPYLLTPSAEGPAKQLSPLDALGVPRNRHPKQGKTTVESASGPPEANPSSPPPRSVPLREEVLFPRAQSAEKRRQIPPTPIQSLLLPDTPVLLGDPGEFVIPSR